MEQSWLSSTIDYVYKSVSGDEAENVRTTSDYQRVFADGVWIRDLPSNSCEPLEATCDMPATPNKNKRETQSDRIATLKALNSENNKLIASLNDKVAELEANGIKSDTGFNEKIEKRQLQLKKAKKDAFLARASVIKKNLELEQLAKELKASKEREAEWKEFASSLQHEIGNMRDCIESLRSAMISKVGDMETKLAASNAELANVKEAEKQLKEDNSSLKCEISELRETFENFKNSIFAEVQGMKRQQSDGNAELARLREHQTKSQWMNPTVREEAGDLKEKLDKANAEIITEEQIIAHKQDKLQDLRQTIQGEQAPSTVNPGSPKDVISCNYSTHPPVFSKAVGQYTPQFNPYRLRAAKAKGVLNSRPLPPCTGPIYRPPAIAQYGPKQPGAEIGSNIWNPCQEGPAKAKQGHYLNGRPMPCDEMASYGVTRVPDAGSSPFKGSEEGFFSRTFNKWFGF